MKNNKKWTSISEYNIQDKYNNQPNFYKNVDNYIKDFPEAKDWKNYILRKDESSKKNIAYWEKEIAPLPYLIFKLSYNSHTCLPGKYGIAHIIHWKNKYWVSLNEGDDLYMIWPENQDATRMECLDKLKELEKLCPCHWDELQDFGYKYD